MYEKIIKIIALYEFLIYVENRKVYKDILNKYKKVMFNISDGNIKKEHFDPLLNVFRLFFEAIPSDDVLAKYIIDKMQEFYEDYSQIE
ncbi:hypothetical protein PG279_10380 [Riemerella anatipestifer]|nr:hypothetical protein [Riemerella anatipestifer]